MAEAGTEPRKVRPDWSAIQRANRAGLLTLRQIGGPARPDASGDPERAARDHWDRDLSACARAKAEARVSKQSVAKPVARAVATQTAARRRALKADIRRLLAVALRMLDELDAVDTRVNKPTGNGADSVQHELQH